MSEQAFINDKLDLTKAEVISAGVDIGAVNSKALLLVDGQPYAFCQVRTTIPKESAHNVMDAVLSKADLKLESIHCIVSTGCGRMQVPYANETVSEIACGAAGAVNVWGPSVRTILDIGGQSCKLIHCTEKGRVTDFSWNDKCAAGIGRSMESFADLVGEDVTEIGTIASKTDQFPKLSDFCSVFSQSEAFDLMRENVPKEQIIAAYHDAMAKRIKALSARSGVQEDFVIIGGLCKNQGIVSALESMLAIRRLTFQNEWHTVGTVALGGALFADAISKRKQTGQR